MQKRWTFALTTAVMVTVAACSDSSNSSDSGTPGSGLTILRLAQTAPPLCNDSTGAWFIKDPNGQDKEIALTFPEGGDMANCALNKTEDFLRLKVLRMSLLRRPDSTLVSNGDSVFISVKWVGSDSILFEMKPTGLLFDPANAPELHIEYGEAGEDLNHDNVINSADSVAEHRLDMWRQERLGDPYFRVGTAKSEELDEIDAKLNGFSRFALAY
jgi:hypothetical protein